MENEKELSGESSTEIVAQKEETIKPEADIDGFIQLRKDFIAKVNAICVEGKDYHVIQGKKSLAKGGAEKIASVFHWTAKFDKDQDALDMLGNIAGLVAFKCTLQNGQIVGEGRGAASLAKNSNDPNKTLKMAQKSAFIDAVLRASGLSDFFTQDLEDMNPSEIGKPQVFPATEKQLQFIDSLMQQKNVSKEQMFDDGFDLDNLTGGKEGTASEAIAYLQNISSYSNGLTPATDEQKAIHLFTVDLEKCTTVAEYNLVCGDIKLAFKNGKLSKNGWAIMLKTCKVIAKKIQDSLPPLETKPKTSSQLAFEKGLAKGKQAV
jgi:hypothetical protein